jgi:thiol:disulfide interchange protein DsbC
VRKKIILTILSALMLAGCATTNNDYVVTNKEIEEYKTTVLKNNKQVTVKSIKVINREKLDGFGNWEVAILIMDLTFDRGGKKQNLKLSDTVFIDGDIIADEIADAKRQKSARESYRPKPDGSYYDTEHLVAGNKDAANKILIFSDPLCPFCRDMVPDIIASAVNNPSKLAVYHYSFPLVSIHPASEMIIKAELSVRGGVKNRADFMTKLYGTNVEPNETDEGKIAAKLSSELGPKIQKADIEKKETLKEYDEELQKAYKLLVRGTPTVYLNGEIDQTKAKTNQLLKELK